MDVIKSDITIVGGGIAGLWLAKELVDQGLSVNVVEKSTSLADGPTTRNEGWLHAGTYHAIAVQNEDEARRVTERTLYGHNAIVDFAPESIDHERSFAFAGSDDLAHEAVERWNRLGIRYEPTNPNNLPDADMLSKETISAAFSVRDKSVNSVTLCQKLAQYIIARGAKIITGVHFDPQDDNLADLHTKTGERFSVESEKFLLTAGVGTNELVKKITGQELLMRYFKAHLLVMPRVTQHNYFYLDVGEAGVMNHGRASIVGINRDGLEISRPNYDMVLEKQELVKQAVSRMMPEATGYEKNKGKLLTTACCKPDIYKSPEDTQSLNIQLFSLTDTYACALPGKMTEAPYLAKEAAAFLNGTTLRNKLLLSLGETVVPSITPRPVDSLIERL
jgi:glycine/D-amino acid oxidase-like deaminating enzyme